ncbi:IS1182 family transposase [Proteiniborus sp. MB09-C3]|uniref:IS1182 family transposase n=1 Tax=Proteiniborus sp. MB09-C3 TaxID=3050072 RepID=UPI00255350A9|nr:IS1182 family transposase [Proteiniborus sp. MB09-C3]WIV12910.1 IS1182 family transposase [Proteiniborus sp. MB09-C3]
MRYIEGINRKSKIAFPEYIDDYISEDNPVRIIDAFVASLDMIALGFKNAVPKDKGRPSYDPKDLLKLYIYGYMNRITSSRTLEKATQTNIEVMWLLRRLTPDFKSISDFRKDNKEAINLVFKQFVALCKEWDLFGKEVVAVDGSKFRASNSKKNNFNTKSLNRKIKYLEEKTEKYMAEIEENDDKESLDRKPNKEEIKEKIRELKERKEKYEAYKEEIENGKTTETSTTDPDSRLMAVNNNGVDVCYNVQTVVDGRHKLVVDCDVINNPTDHGMLSKMAKSAKEIFDVEELKTLADKGYYNAVDLKICEKENIITYVAKQVFPNSTGEEEFYLDKFKYDKEENVYICPKGERLYSRRQKPIDENTKEIVYRNFEACGKCEFKDKCTKDTKGRRIRRSIDQDCLDIVDERTSENKEFYRQRQMIVEHPFKTVKRGFGITYFLTRGLESVKAEASLAFLAYDMKRVINILGIREIIRRLTGKKAPVNPLFSKHAILFGNIKQLIA